MKHSGNTILITGGGSGIGQALAWRFHALGNSVIVAGRRIEALQETVAGREGMHAVALDVEDAAAVKAFAAALIADHPGLNVLINNAGVFQTEEASVARDLASADAMVITNILGPIRLIDALVDHLAATPNAAIVNVTSGLAFVPMVTGPTYSATKAALHSYTVALREQLRGTIEVIELAPPGVQTDLTPGQSTREGYMPLAEFTDEVMSLFRQLPTPAEVLVDRVKPLRTAEAEGRFDQMLAAVNGL